MKIHLAGMPMCDTVLQLTPWDRESLELPMSTQNKDGVWQCKKHGSTGMHAYAQASQGVPDHVFSADCNLCYGWKKQLSKLHTKAKKAGKKAL